MPMRSLSSSAQVCATPRAWSLKLPLSAQLPPAKRQRLSKSAAYPPSKSTFALNENRLLTYNRLVQPQDLRNNLSTLHQARPTDASHNARNDHPLLIPSDRLSLDRSSSRLPLPYPPSSPPQNAHPIHPARPPPSISPYPHTKLLLLAPSDTYLARDITSDRCSSARAGSPRRRCSPTTRRSGRCTSIQS